MSFGVITGIGLVTVTGVLLVFAGTDDAVEVSEKHKINTARRGNVLFINRLVLIKVNQIYPKAASQKSLGNFKKC